MTLGFIAWEVGWRCHSLRERTLEESQIGKKICMSS